ncbi:hypothetical protein CAMGR0001_0991 [Campylobacter gracilis RM3268]|uniref:Uncharacterized protein n=1 Tax=Campylobacter gracilis RM3268 TaxID=553220 RepID=C8PGJ6_9BACT|nr:hypothetical protein CAMGR0001_0991 [Campylobacter gracilis RM3268]
MRALKRWRAYKRRKFAEFKNLQNFKTSRIYGLFKFIKF